MQDKSRSDIKYMRIALALAARGMNRVHPNPMVGCIIVRDGKIVGRGHHDFFGGPHAEVMALSQARDAARGATLYVTLEPCSHSGKTPPCTDAIIRSGISRVVAAMRDPNPNVSGGGLRTLRKNFVDVTEGVLALKARDLNKDYIRNLKRRTARVAVKFAMSADGKIATRTGDSKWITSVRSRRFVHELRSNFDAIVVGSRTARMDNPALTSHGRGSNPVRVVIDPDLRVPLSHRIFDSSAATVVFHATPSGRRKLAALTKRHVLTVRLSRTRGMIPFEEIVRVLRRFSLTSILIEGGGETIASALEAGVVTEVYVFIAPRIIGGRFAVSGVGGRGVARVAEALKLHHPRLVKIGSDYLLNAEIRNKPSPERRLKNVHRPH